MDIDKALETQLRNLQQRSGRTLEQLYDAIRASGLARHGEIVAMLKRDFAMGHGDANLVAHSYRAAASPPTASTSSPPSASSSLPRVAERLPA
jgi:hypothetical protein